MVLNAVDERTDIGGTVIATGKFEGMRISELDRYNREELDFEAYRGCARYGDRAALRLYIRHLGERQEWINGRRERRGLGGNDGR
jgi:hypothetical protein